MKKVIILFFSLAFLASTCKEEGPDCHYKIVIINNTSDSIICATKSYWGSSGLCNISGKTLKFHETFELSLHECWESRLANGQYKEIYIVDPNHYNTPEVFYNCDSIEIKNKILKYYKLTLDDLKKLDFAITYP